MTLTVTNTANDASLLVGGIEALKFNSQGLITTPITVRQTVELGPVDTNGFASFGGSTGSTTVTASSGTLYLNAANGMVNRRGSITNPSWTGASTNGTMYAYLDIATDGSCTSGLSTLAPTYRWGGADVVTSGQFTFNIQEMTGKVGNGATAVQTYRVYVGEFTVSGSVVTAIVWYALMGRYDSGYTATLPAASTLTVKNHNIGINYLLPKFIIECTSTDNGYAVGDTLDSITFNGAGYTVPPLAYTRTTCFLATNTSGSPFIITHKSTYAVVSLTNANWKYKLTAQRGW